MFLRKLFGLVPEDPFTRGLDHFEKGQLRRAVAAFAPLLGSADESLRSKAALYTCEAYLQLGDEIVDTDVQAALTCYEAAAELQPTFADIQEKIGKLRLDLGHHELAEAAFRRALAINPRFFRAHVNLVATLVRWRGGENALSEVERLRQHAPEIYDEDLAALAGACRDGDLQTARARLDLIDQRSPSQREVLRQAALRALRRNEPEKAALALEDLLNGQRRYPDLLQLLGLAYSKMGRHDDAEAAFRAALEVHPGYQKARINLALALMELDRLDEATREFERVLEDDPGHPLALSALEEIRGAITEG